MISQRNIGVVRSTGSVDNSGPKCQQHFVKISGIVSFDRRTIEKEIIIYSLHYTRFKLEMMMNIVLILSILVAVQSFRVQNKRVSAYIKKGNLI